MERRKELNGKEIRELANLVKRLYAYQLSLRKKHQLAHAIKFPQVPAVLSESLVASLANSGRIMTSLRGYQYTVGPKKVADVVGRKNKAVVRIEVKGVASEGFQRLSGGDITADYLIIVNFGEYFINPRITLVEIWTIERPGNYFKKIGYTSLKKIEETVGSKIISIKTKL